MDPKTTDPVIIDLIKWLKENLPDDVNEEDIFKKVRRVQKVFDTLIGLSFEEFYRYALNLHREKPREEDAAVSDDNNDRHTSPDSNVDGDNDDEGSNETNDSEGRETASNCSESRPPNKPQERTPKVMTLEDIVNSKLEEMKEYVSLNEEKQLKTKKLNASTAKLDLKKEHYNLITSIRLDSCRDLMSRYNRLMSKK